MENLTFVYFVVTYIVKRFFILYVENVKRFWEEESNGAEFFRGCKAAFGVIRGRFF